MRRWLSAAAAVVILTGCAQAAPPSPAATPGPASSPAGETQTPPAAGATLVQVVVTLTDGKAEPNGLRVELSVGDTLEFVVTSDHDDELHVHGMEATIPVKGGETVVQQVVVDKVGRFEVESHNPALVIAQLVVR